MSRSPRSVAVKKLEEELDEAFERSAGEVTVTPLGEEIVRQAKACWSRRRPSRKSPSAADPLAGPLTLGVIYTIGPLPAAELVRQSITRTPQMPLMLQENFTVKLLEMLRTGEIDCAILAEPFPDTGLAIAPLYDEPFMAAVPSTHPLASKKSVTAAELKNETMLLLGAGHCFRDHVLEVCPEFARFASNAEGIPSRSRARRWRPSSTWWPQAWRDAGAPPVGATRRPAHGVAPPQERRELHPLPAHRRKDGSPAHAPVVLAWRRSFTRYEAIAALRNAIYACELLGVTRLS